MNTLRIPYGRGMRELDCTGWRADILLPPPESALADEAAGFQDAVRHPIGSAPLREVIRPEAKLAVTIPDGTRPFPASRILPRFFAEIAHVPPEQVVIVIGTGSHRGNTPEEIVRMVGPEVAARYRILNHDSENPARLVSVGPSRFGYDVQLCREWVEADQRVMMGFIEPHFMAGFSGGYKAVFPGLAGLDAIMHYHSVANIAHPASTWGRIDGNPTQDHVRAGGSIVPVDFCVNLTLGADKRINRYFCGEPLSAHEAGCRHLQETAMIPCRRAYPIVVTTNGGWPLDQNLYQTVKGLSAASLITDPGGFIIAAAECADGFPDHGCFRGVLESHRSPEDLLVKIAAGRLDIPDRWQIQLLAQLAARFRIRIVSGFSDADLQRTFLTPAASIEDAVADARRELGPDAPVAILPQGPLALPFRT